MILVIEILFVLFLAAILFTLYRNEKASSRERIQHAKVEEYWGGKERRQHIRFRTVLDVTYNVVKKVHLVNNCTAIDISEGGLKLCLTEKLAKGAILDLKISVPTVRRPVELEGEVVWSEDAAGEDASGKRIFHAGIKFRSIKEPSGASLIDYIHSLG